jgi:hypothetical protein
MGTRIKTKITTAQLNSRTRKDGKAVPFPAAWVGAFCSVTGYDALAIYVLPEHLRRTLEIGECVIASEGSLENALALVRSLKERPRTRKGTGGRKK